MDSRLAKLTFDYGSVQTHGAVSIKLLLQAGATNRLRTVAHESDRRDLYGKALLWFSENYPDSSKGRTQRQSQTNSKDHARLGALWEQTRPQYLETPSTTCQISVSSPKLYNLRPITGLEHRYHVHPSTKWFCLPGCCNRLVQSAGALAPLIKQSRNSVLLGSLRRGDCQLWEARNLQHRSRGTVHIGRVRECSAWQKYSLQHGWQRKGSRQYFRRKTLEVCKI